LVSVSWNVFRHETSASSRKATVVLSDYLPGYAGAVVHVELFNPGDSPSVWETDVALNAVGSFTLDPSIPAGRYDVRVRASHWLAKKVPDVPFDQDYIRLDFALTNGDIDGENSVTVLDNARLSSAFDSVPEDTNWDTNADLDGDSSVTNFERSGD